MALTAMGYAYRRLQTENALYEKDKSVLARGGESLRKMWRDFKSSPKYLAMQQAKLNATNAIRSVAGVAPLSGASADTAAVRNLAARQRELEMSNRGLLDDDEELDDTDMRAVRA